MKKLIMILAGVMLVIASAFAQTTPNPPVFSIQGGVYETDSALFLELSGEGDIYYTTDGSVPTVNSKKYTSAIRIDKGDYNNASSTIRAAVIVDGVSSYVSSNTYFLGSGIFSAVGDVPIVNIVAEPYDLWDSSNGIYTNYNYEHKVPATVHYISTDGKTEINRHVEIKVSGHGSRSAAKKSIRVYFKKTDPLQSKYLEYNLIPDAGVDYISKVTFRISDWQSTNFRDVLAQEIGERTRVATAQSTPVAMYLNGAYWGLYECREQYDNDYLASHYGIDKDNIVFLDRDWTVAPQYSVLPETGTQYVDKIEYSEGPADDNKDGKLGETYYRNQWTYIKSLTMEKDITSKEVYDEFCSKVDVDNFIDYIITYIYCGNDDWPGNNFKFWRVTEEDIDPSNPVSDGKWRFMIHDFDISFENANHETLRLSALEKLGVNEARHPAFATAMIDGLLKNSEFRNEFAQRTMVYLSGIMSSNEVNAIIDKLAAQRQKGKAADIKRWNLGSIQNWNWNVNNLKWFISQRPEKLKNQYISVLNNNYGAKINGTAQVKVTSQCDYEISGARLTGNKSLEVFSGIPVTITAPNASITVTADGKTVTAEDEYSFTPNGSSEIVIENIPNRFEIKSVRVIEGQVEVDYTTEKNYEGEATLYVAGFDEDGNVVYVKSTNNKAVPVNNKAVVYRAFLWDGMEPLCESVLSD